MSDKDMLTVSVKTLKPFSLKIVVKTSIDTPRQPYENHVQDEMIHQAFVGRHAVNPAIKHIPNVAYTYGYTHDREQGTMHVMSEYIPGNTMLKCMQSGKISVQQYLAISSQLCLALSVMQQQTAFIHHDLTPWNIIITYSDVMHHFTYSDYPEGVYHVKTREWPVMIDYGKSYAVVDGKHHGYVNRYAPDPLQDWFVYMVTSLSELLQSLRTISHQDASVLLKVASFALREDKTFKTLRELKLFLKDAKRYTLRTNQTFTQEIMKHDCTMVEIASFLSNLYMSQVNTASRIYSVSFKRLPCNVPKRLDTDPVQVFESFFCSDILLTFKRALNRIARPDTSLSYTHCHSILEQLDVLYTQATTYRRCASAARSQFVPPDVKRSIQAKYESIRTHVQTIRDAYTRYMVSQPIVPCRRHHAVHSPSMLQYSPDDSLNPLKWSQLVNAAKNITVHTYKPCPLFEHLIYDSNICSTLQCDDKIYELENILQHLHDAVPEDERSPNYLFNIHTVYASIMTIRSQ